MMVGKWGLGNGGWEMGVGKWEMRDGKGKVKKLSSRFLNEN